MPILITSDWRADDFLGVTLGDALIVSAELVTGYTSDTRSSKQGV